MTGANFRSEDIPDLSGQVIIVTGGNAGLGLETIKQLSQHNPARIYLAARSEEKAEAAIKQIKEGNPKTSPISFLQLDLASFASIRAAAETFTKSESRLDILINNAGIMMTPEGLTKEGYEIQFGTNVMGPALFSHLLLPVLQNTVKTNPQTRVVMLASASEKMAPSDAYQLEELKTTMPHRNTTARYTLSKLAAIHYATAMAERHHDVKFLSVHPGMVATNLHHSSTGFFLRPFLYSAIMFATPVEKGALSQIWAAVSPDAKAGEYYGPIGVAGKGSKASKNRELQEKIFKWIQDELQGHL
ncbi:hypothetical protein NM208_g9659 [Fusarium decemcellulare]|uniref:Uncharacterized protein n=1 Tax=Fusarium decemcellulare TaxID=57161 RepID=A0ACC1S0Q4_9HYPO|nr:hypothetical protein NM208_g9659 [Fusarium decemcellulare]